MGMEATSIDAHAPRNETVAEAKQRCPLGDFIGQWWVLHTKSRNEKSVAADLSNHGIAHFLPLAKCVRRFGARVRHVEIPLFPGYVFLCGTEADRVAALRTHRVAYAISVPDQAHLLADLQQIWLVVSSGEPVNLFPQLQEGSRCRVLEGSLRGLEGVVLKRTGPWRVYVAVRFLGQSVELEIDPSRLELIE